MIDFTTIQTFATGGAIIAENTKLSGENKILRNAIIVVTIASIILLLIAISKPANITVPSQIKNKDETIT